MKRVKIWCVCIGLSFIACSNSTSTVNTDNQTGFNGKWRWTITTGGIGGWTYTPTTEGYTCTLTVLSDSSCSISRNDSVVANGSYSAGKIDSTHFYFTLGKGFVDAVLNQRLPNVTIKSNSPIRVFIKTDTITVSEEAVADGFVTEFVKIK